MYLRLRQWEGMDGPANIIKENSQGINQGRNVSNKEQEKIEV